MIMLIILPAYTIYGQTISEDEWKLARDKQDIQIYTRQMTNSKLKEYKAYISIRTSVDKVVEVLQDVDNYNKWMVNLKSSKLLNKISEDESYIYSEAKLPWPFDNRDIVNHINVYWSVDRDTAALVIHGVSDYVPEKKGIIRMPKSEGIWNISKINNDFVNVEYKYGGDPGGGIPNWVVNIFIVDSPYKTLINMREYMEIKSE